jgi:hypothetical protein
MIYSINLDGFAVVISIIWMKILRYFKSRVRMGLFSFLWTIHARRNSIWNHFIIAAVMFKAKLAIT